MALTLDKAFDPRSNSIGFLRWALAFIVIFSHAGPLAGFYGGKSLGNQWTDQQSFGGVAVSGFFFLSGFLITKSRMGRSSIFRFLWRRFLRILPAFYAALLLTAFVFAPIAFWRVNGSLSGFLSASDSPISYVLDNAFLKIRQEGIAGLGAGTPLAQCCTLDWNGSAWTLFYEFKGYILIGVLGLFGVLGYRKIASIAFGFMLLMNTLTFLSVNANTSILHPLMSNFFNIMLLTPFFFGMMFALWPEKIPIDDRLAVAAAGIAVFTYFIASGWNVYGQFAFLYLIMWCAIRLPLRNWERYGDLSYGTYIYAWPIMQFTAFFGLYKLGWLGYHVVITVLCTGAAFFSWHVIEKRALALKNWTPRWLAALLRRFEPLETRIKRTIVNPDFSSTHYAHVLRRDAEALRHDRSEDELVTLLPSERVHPSSSHAIAPHAPGRTAPPPPSAPAAAPRAPGAQSESDDEQPTHPTRAMERHGAS